MRRAIGLVVAMLVACVTVIVAAPGTASAGFAPVRVNVTKVVVGDAPPGTTFVVRIQCDGTPQADADFDATGGMQVKSFVAVSPFCSVSEPENGGANSTTFACESRDLTCDTSTFVIIRPDAEVDITVTNTFVPPPPPAAAAVPAAPTFTG